mmetsp:Transcript_5721/g.6601  ORF Transcript_5721/g.6601 Transcript_5721/m.6601 type:complete len:344 (-) Transcript_5721:107-1138(-)
MPVYLKMSDAQDDELLFGSSAADCKQLGVRKRPYANPVTAREHCLGFSKKRITADQYGKPAPTSEQLYIDYAQAQNHFPTERPQLHGHFDRRLANPYYALERQAAAPQYNFYDMNLFTDVGLGFHHGVTRVDKSQGRKWTAEEDDILRKGVEFFTKQKKQIDFNSIIARLPNRSVKQAKERWGNCLTPEITKGEWSQEEIKKLLKLIAEHGPQWTVIQRNLKSRSMHCIKSKGRKLLGESLNKRARKLVGAKPVNKYWSETEQKNLLNFHEIHQYDFEEICLDLARRGFCRPPAQIERQLLETCPCKTCNERKAAVERPDEGLKIAWTKAKALTLLSKMESAK